MNARSFIKLLGIGFLCGIVSLDAAHAKVALQELTLTGLADHVTTFLQNKAGMGDVEIEATIIQPTEPIKIPAGPYAVEVKDRNPQPGVSRRSFQVIITQGAGSVATLTVLADIDVFLHLPVLSKTIRVDELIAEEDLRMVRQKIQRPGQEWVLSPEQAIGKRAVRPLLPDRPIPAAALGNPYIIKKGDRLRIHLENGGLLIQMDALADTKGAIGQLINVVNAESGRKLQAMITGPGTGVIH